MLAVAHNLQKILAHLSPSNDFIFVFQDKKKNESARRTVRSAK
jgi:hypothetical protein